MNEINLSEEEIVLPQLQLNNKIKLNKNINLSPFFYFRSPGVSQNKSQIELYHEASSNISKSIKKNKIESYPKSMLLELARKHLSPLKATPEKLMQKQVQIDSFQIMQCQSKNIPNKKINIMKKTMKEFSFEKEPIHKIKFSTPMTIKKHILSNSYILNKKKVLELFKYSNSFNFIFINEF